MKLTDRDIDRLVDRVVERIAGGSPGGGGAGIPGPTPVPAPNPYAGPLVGPGDPGVFERVDDAVRAAQRAFQDLRACSLQTRAAMIEGMRRITVEHTDQLSRMAVAETGLGRVEDKLRKNRVAALKSPGPEFLRPEAFSGDDGLALVEYAPFGIIGAVTPCTNATETIINNAIGMVSAGNAVVFNVHPSAKGVCNYHVSLINRAITEAGGPANVVCSIANPSIQSANELMGHPGIRLVVVTGGGAVVKAAMSTGKRAIAAGPGNPPVVVDDTADIKRAARGVIDGCSVDNNIVCIAEKELIAVADIADLLKREMLAYSAVEIKGRDLARLEKLLITDDNHVNRAFVGKNANVIANEIGIRVGDDVRILLCEVDDESHPFVQHEMLMPVLSMVRVPSVDAAIDMAVRVEHGFRHTAVMYSTNIDALHRMAVACDASIYVKNAPSYSGIGMGGEGYTSWTIAGPTGEGLTSCRTFSRIRRCTLKDYFRIV
jgi:acyl-CoA reductase-like NAD-dependent aldehyde dehydrogenase